jgi:hypothetical protein
LGFPVHGCGEDVCHKARAGDRTFYLMVTAGSVPTSRDLDAPASVSDADVGWPRSLGFPLHGCCEDVCHKARAGDRTFYLCENVTFS